MTNIEIDRSMMLELLNLHRKYTSMKTSDQERGVQPRNYYQIMDKLVRHNFYLATLAEEINKKKIDKYVFPRLIKAPSDGDRSSNNWLLEMCCEDGYDMIIKLCMSPKVMNAVNDRLNSQNIQSSIIEMQRFDAPKLANQFRMYIREGKLISTRQVPDIISTKPSVSIDSIKRMIPRVFKELDCQSKSMKVDVEFLTENTYRILFIHPYEDNKIDYSLSHYIIEGIKV